MDGACSVVGCKRLAITRGWCDMHYRRVLRTEDPGPPGPIVRERGMCCVEGCDAPVDAKELCHGHYQRLDGDRRSKDPSIIGMEIDWTIDWRISNSGPHLSRADNE